jgi:hypothetical protein
MEHRLIDGLLIINKYSQTQGDIQLELSAGLCLWREWDLLKDVVNDSPRGKDNDIVE